MIKTFYEKHIFLQRTLLRYYTVIYNDKMSIFKNIKNQILNNCINKENLKMSRLGESPINNIYLPISNGL